VCGSQGPKGTGHVGFSFIYSTMYVRPKSGGRTRVSGGHSCSVEFIWRLWFIKSSIQAKRVKEMLGQRIRACDREGQSR